MILPALLGRLAAPLLVMACSFATARRAAAQTVIDPHAAQPERPTVATHAGTVAPGWVEVEWGVERDRVASGPSAISTPTLLKLGIAPAVQFDVTLATVRPSSGGAIGVGDAGVGVKWRLADGAPLVGDFAVQPSVKFPTGSAARGTGTGTTDASFLLISSHVLGPTALDVNVGYTRRSPGGEAGNAVLWTVATGTMTRGPLAFDAECYGYPGFAAKPTVALLAGPTYTIHPWFVADAGFIADIRGRQPPALYAGLTWNVGRW